MASYTPENNPLIPGDPYSYDLKWMVEQINGWKDPLDSADRAKASEEAAAASAEAADLSAQAAADSADAAKDSEDAAKDYADHIADPVSGLVADWLANHITQPTTPAIDTSLTVAGAAADAKVTGDAINEVSSNLSEMITANRTENLFSGWIENRRYTSSGDISSGNNSKYIASDYMDISEYAPITAGMQFYIKGINASALSYYVFCYDSDKVYQGRSGVSADGYISIVANDAAYIIIASNMPFSSAEDMNSYVDSAEVIISKNDIPYIPYYTYKIKPSYLPDNKGKPLVVWIDDDTSSLARLIRVKNVSDTVGITPTLACITKYIVPGDDEVAGLKDRLLELQNDYGYEIVSHSYDHGDIWKSWQPGIYDPSECEKSLIKSMEDLRSAGFLEYDYLVAPFGESSESTQNFTKKWAKCLVNAGGNGTGQNYTDTDSIWNINRIFISDADDQPLSYYTNMIDFAKENNSLLIFGTHLSSDDVQLTIDVLNYAKNSNVEITTLSSAIRQKKHWYYRNELL